MSKRTNEIKFAGNYVTILGDRVEAGQKAPDFVALKNDLSEYKLSDNSGKVRIISVVPSVDTGVCALQTERFNKEAANLPNVEIVTISVDLPFALGRFCGDKGIENSVTLSDHKTLDFGTKYGFVVEELRLLTRGIVVVGADDTIKYVEYVGEITDHPNYDAVLEVVKGL